MSCPVIQRASPEIRYAITAPTSPGSPIRPSVVRAACGAISSGNRSKASSPSPRCAAVSQLGQADSRLSRVAHAVRWLREHYAESVRVDELARMTQMSPSAFHRSFQAVTSLSPIQFQK